MKTIIQINSYSIRQFKRRISHFFFTLVLSAIAFGDIIAQTTTVYPSENNQILLNPGKGWVLYADLTSQPQSVWDVSTVGYTRTSWAAIEPTEGSFNWSVIDDQIATCVAKGKKFAFGIYNISSSDGADNTPTWVWNAGATYTTLQATDNLTGQTYTKKVPVWDNSVFMAKQQNFITAIKNRYDGNSNIAFIDIRNFGNWGEWHLFGLNGSSDISNAKKRDHIRMWKNFTNTTLVLPINTMNNNETPEDNATFATDSFKIGYKREGLIKLTESQDGCTYVYDNAPAIGEFYGSYQWLVNDGSWSDAQLDKTFSEGKFSYMGMGQWGTDAATMFSQKNSLINSWANKMGYWFKLLEATYSNSLGNGSSGTITFKMFNEGIAPCYLNNNSSCVKVALLDANNNVLQTAVLSGVNPFNWKPGQLVTESNKTFSFSSQSSGTKLAIGVFSKQSLSSPDIKMGINGAVSGNWYVLTSMSTTAPSAPVGKTIFIRGNNGKYFSARENETDAPVKSNGPSVSLWEKFVCVDAGNGKIALLGNNGKYFSARENETDAPVKCSGPSINSWESFTWVNMGSAKFALLGNNGKYFSARENESNAPVKCTGPSIGSWETLSWGEASSKDVPINKTIWLKGNNGQYLSARENETNIPVKCNGPNVNAWEKFLVVDAGEGKIALKANNNNYISARENETDAPVKAISSAIKEWESFIWTKESSGKIVFKANNAKYFSARENETGIPVKANGPSINIWEKFDWGETSGGGGARVAQDQSLPQSSSETNEIGLFVYPNPSSGFITVSYTSDISESIQINMITSNGIQFEKLYAGKVEKNIPFVHVIDVTGFSKGIYLIQLHTHTGLKNRKVILSK